MLAGIDYLAESHPRIVFVATTNFPEAVDGALLSRSDLMLTLGLPEEATIAAILQRSLAELAGIRPPARPLAEETALHRKLAAHSAGWDGHHVPEVVLTALAGGHGVAEQNTVGVIGRARVARIRARNRSGRGRKKRSARYSRQIRAVP